MNHTHSQDMSGEVLLPRATLRDVMMGEAPLVGTRLDPSLPRGYFSPVEARVNTGINVGDLYLEERNALKTGNWLTFGTAAARAVLSAPLRTTAKQEWVSRPKIVSVAVDNITAEEAIEHIVSAPQKAMARAKVIHFVHPHAVNLAVNNKTLAHQFASADWVLPDGSGIRLAGKLLGAELIHNINGTDLLGPLCEKLADRQIPLVLVGAAPGVAEKAAEKLRLKYSGLNISIIAHGFLNEEETESLIESIDAIGPCVVLVAMGTPLQESWAWRYAHRLRQSVLVTVGGLFDFTAENVSRAPIQWRELGLEWLYRLIQEPRRLAWRYVVGNPLFVLRVLRQRLVGVSSERLSCWGGLRVKEARMTTGTTKTTPFDGEQIPGGDSPTGVNELCENMNAYIPLGPAEERVVDPCFIVSMGSEKSHPEFNVVFRLRLAEGNLEQSVQRAREIFESRGRRCASWEVGPSAQPKKLTEQLLQLGMQRYHEPYCTMLMLDSPLPIKQSEIVVKKAETIDDYLIGYDILHEVFGQRIESIEERQKRAEDSLASRDKTGRSLYVAYLGGQPIAAASAITIKSAMILGGAGTTAAARGRGAYQALVAARYADAERKGITKLMIQAGEMSRPILERMGFRSLGRIEIVVDRW